MERRKSKQKGIRRLASVNNKKKTSLHDLTKLPAPTYELEDALLSQLHVSDVMNNCVMSENLSTWSIGNELGGTGSMKRKASLVYHRCFNDTTLVPLWHAFSVLDVRGMGHALLGKLMNLTSCLTKVLGEEHTEMTIQKQFLNYAHVPFSKYKRYVVDATSADVLDAELLSSLCWNFCKQRYLNNPMVDGLDSVVPSDLCDSLYYLFCVFNKLTEPGTYPPTMDYEEVELLLRKLFACLGIPWSTSYEETQQYNDDAERDYDYETNSSLQITFQQLLSITVDMVGVEVCRSSLFHRAVQNLCLIEYLEVVKTGWLTARKEDNDSWRKRWAVLHQTTITFYDTILCQTVKEEVDLNSNMQVESLPGTSSHKHRFRIAEKEGFNITRELEFSASSSTAAHSWTTLLNVSIKILDTGMSTKTAEISERRLKRFKRRESLREVHKKKLDLQETYNRLEEARKCRFDIMGRLSERSQQRQAQIDYLEKATSIYEKLEEVQEKINQTKKEERRKHLKKLHKQYEESVEQGKIFDISNWNKFEDSKTLSSLSAEKSKLERTLQDLHRSSLVISCTDLPTLNFVAPKRSSSLDHTSFSSSENVSSTSNELAPATQDLTRISPASGISNRLTVPEMTS